MVRDAPISMGVSALVGPMQQPPEVRPVGSEPRFWTTQDSAFLLALTSTALALGAALAHVLELPNKMKLDMADYFVAQRLYDGWDKLGFLIAVELAAILWVVFATRHDPATRRLALLALAGLVAAQVVFWVFTFPANQATANWTTVPADWAALRWRWEVSHAAGAACQAAALLALVVAALARRAPDGRH